MVDDDEQMLSTISAVLSTEVDVVECTSAEHALALLETREFHLVCSDLLMPGMRGDELLRKVSIMPVYTSCLLITGAEEYARSKEAAYHHVLLKPFHPDRLVAIVLQLARLTEMKRSVHSMADSLTPTDPGGELVSCDWTEPSALPESSRAPRSARFAGRMTCGPAALELQELQPASAVAPSPRARRPRAR
ncbi:MULTISPECIES: response regulator [Sorangium]|uniref:response regulator n=1 Tax=Sorangium TaxID=39643 RepID=UPI00101A21B0|nr:MULTISPECIES: response regulator [Sorangium]